MENPASRSVWPVSQWRKSSCYGRYLLPMARSTCYEEYYVHSYYEIVTDNGPQFTSTEFSTYLSSSGIAHRKVTPYWPQANSEVERFNRTVEKAIRAANIEGKNWKEELDVTETTLRTPDYEKRECDT